MYRNYVVLNQTPMTSDGTTVLTVRVQGGTRSEPNQTFDLSARREWSEDELMAAINQIAVKRNAIESFVETLALNTPMPLQRTPAAPTAFQVWVAKARRLQLAKALGLTNVTATGEITTLEADVNTSYQAGFLASL